MIYLCVCTCDIYTYTCDDICDQFTKILYAHSYHIFKCINTMNKGDNPNCLVIDDDLNILPISSHVASIPDSDDTGSMRRGGFEEGDTDISGVPEVSNIHTIHA